MRDVARGAGLTIDWSQMPDQNAVMAAAYRHGNAPLVDALAPCVAPLTGPTLSAQQQRGRRLRAVAFPHAPTADRPASAIEKRAPQAPARDAGPER